MEVSDIPFNYKRKEWKLRHNMQTKPKRESFKIVTKDEFMLEYETRFHCGKRRSEEVFKNISREHNFIFIKDGVYYNIEYLDELLKR